MQLKKIIFSLLFLVLFSNKIAVAASSDWVEAYEHSAKLRTIASLYEKDGEKKLIAGLHFKINSGWKIYGIDSGDFGLPPQLDLKESSNYKSHQILWPEAKTAKEEIGDEEIIYSYYSNEVILPIEIDLKNLSEETTLNFKVNYGICKDICIPASAEFSLKIDEKIDEAVLTQIQKFYPSKQIIKTTEAEAKEVGMSHLAMTIYAILFGIIGGAILNIMPCVLPVLSIKLISIISHSNAPIAKIRLSFLSTIAGILVSFVFFAFATIILKNTGASLGWGLQFQNPYFLIFLITILTLFAANLFGFFEFSFRYILTNFLNKKISESEEKKNIFIPNFLSGILAVLLATPCSAPFLGSAISFALVSDSLTIFIILFSIGIGLALPYIVLIFSPKLISYLPKPGDWMLKVKKLMAVFLVATIIWLLYVLSHNIGDMPSLIVFGLCVLVLMSFKIKSTFFRSLAISLLVIAIFALPLDFKNDKSANYLKSDNAKYDILWKEFSEEKISQYLAEGKVVVVDITADWCLTCKFNKIRVFHDPEIMMLIETDTIIGLRADMTKPNEEILKFMKKNGRFAIPFNMVYGPNAKDGLLTSELLTKEQLLELIKKAQND